MVNSLVREETVTQSLTFPGSLDAHLLYVDEPKFQVHVCPGEDSRASLVARTLVIHLQQVVVSLDFVGRNVFTVSTQSSPDWEVPLIDRSVYGGFIFGYGQIIKLVPAVPSSCLPRY